MSRKTSVVKSQEKESKRQRSTQASRCPRLGVEEGAVVVCKQSFQEGSPGALWDKTQKEGLWQRIRFPPELVLHLSSGGPSWRLQGCTLNELGRGGMSRKTAGRWGFQGHRREIVEDRPTVRHFTEFLPVSQSSNPWILFLLFSSFYSLFSLRLYTSSALSYIKIFLSHWATPHWVTPFSLSLLHN